LPEDKPSARAVKHKAGGKTDTDAAPAFPLDLERWAPDLFRLAFSLTGNVDDAEDLLQDTYLAALERWRQFEGRSSVKTWLAGILVRQAARRRRYAAVRKTLSLDGVAGALRSAFGHRQPTGRLSGREMRMDIETILGALSAEHRTVLALREVQGMSYNEIADALGVPVGTVESRLYRARRTLKERFGDYFA